MDQHAPVLHGAAEVEGGREVSDADECLGNRPRIGAGREELFQEDVHMGEQMHTDGVRCRPTSPPQPRAEPEVLFEQLGTPQRHGEHRGILREVTGRLPRRVRHYRLHGELVVREPADQRRRPRRHPARRVGKGPLGGQKNLHPIRARRALGRPIAPVRCMTRRDPDCQPVGSIWLRSRSSGPCRAPWCSVPRLHRDSAFRPISGACWRNRDGRSTPPRVTQTGRRWRRR